VKIEKSGSHKDIHGKGNEKKTSIHESPCVTHFHFSSFIFNKEKDSPPTIFSQSFLIQCFGIYLSGLILLLLLLLLPASCHSGLGIMPLRNANHPTFPVVDPNPSFSKVTDNLSEGDLVTGITLTAVGIVVGWRTGGGSSPFFFFFFSFANF